MMKRFALLLAALFVASMVLVGPVFASGNHEHNNGEHKDYRWVSQDNKDHGDKVVKDKFCEHRDHNGEHRDHNGEHKNNNGEHRGNNGDNGHANNNDDDNGHANNNDDDWS